MPIAVTPEVRAPLALEQIRLAELFRGTPVAFTLQQDGSLRATVPRQFSFDVGAIKVKPPLAAVLDRLARSQFQSTSRMRVIAPSDPDSRGGNLRAHHVQPFAKHPERRFDVANGITLCHPCHELKHFKPDSTRNIRKLKRGEKLWK